MSNEELYDKVVAAFKSGDENLFNASARNWIEGAEEAPFENAHAKDVFMAAKSDDRLWRSGAINGRVSKIRMIKKVHEIMEMNLPNPYKKSEEVKKVSVKPEPKKEPAPQKEPSHIMGVIPDKKPVPVGGIPAKKPPKEHFFGKHKRP